MKVNKNVAIIAIIIGLIILLNPNPNPTLDEKKENPALLGLSQIELASIGAGALAGGGGLTLSGVGSALGIPLLIGGAIMLFFAFAGFQFLSSNFVLILGALVLIVFFKVMAGKRR